MHFSLEQFYIEKWDFIADGPLVVLSTEFHPGRDLVSRNLVNLRKSLRRLLESSSLLSESTKELHQLLVNEYL